MKYFAAVALLVSLFGAAHGATSTTGTSGWGGHDPLMAGFDGRNFEFLGKPGNVYNVLSEKSHQLSMKLKEGKMWDHTGSYIDTLGFKYLEHTVEIGNEGDNLVVTLDGERLKMRPSQTEQEVILGLAQGEMQLLWQLHRTDIGNAVEITTDLLQLVAYIVPAGSRDEGGVIQPEYLNFDVTLLATPAHGALEGIVGETYARAVSTNAKPEEDDFKFHGVEAEYEMPALFETTHAKSIFGRASATKGRKLIEQSVTLPLRANSRGYSKVFHAAAQGLIKSRKGLN